MKKSLLLILTIALFSINRISAQSYIMQAATSGQTHVTCQGFIQNTLCSYGPPGPSFTAYCQGIDRWEAFTNSGTGPIRINLTSLALNTGDQVRIYNGVGTGGALLATYINTVTSIGNYVTAASGTITVRFTTNSDGAVGDGFTAIIGCQPTGCAGNNPAGDTCSTATRICDASPYCGNTGGWYTADKENIDATGSGVFCGSIENNSWIVFTANTTSASFKVDVANCADATTGIQMQMYATNCTTFTAVSSCINQNTAPTSFTLNSSVALTPGTDYNLMVDGFAGNYCNYTVTPLVGAQIASLSISSNTLCSGQTNTLTLSGVTSGSTYTWTASSAGAISGSTTNSFVIVTPTTNTTYSITVNQPNGCSVDTYTRTLVVNPVPSMTSANTATVCSGTALNFGLSSSIPSTFSWIAANNANTTGESTSAVASGTINNTITNTTTVTQSVIYSVTPTSTLGSCTGSTQIVTVSVNPLPSPTITSSSTLCLGSSLTFTGTGASTYTWTTGGTGGLSASTGSTVSATPTATGSINYTTNVTSVEGCTNTAGKTITVNPNPTANAGSGGVLTCSTTSLGLSGSGGSSYTWTGPGVVSGSATATPSVNLPGTYSLVVTSSLSCSSPAATVAVTQNTVAPAVTSSVSAVLNCTLTSVNIVATTTTSPVSYTWTGTGITAGSGSSSGTVNQPGIFNYTVTNTSNGCITTGSQAVTQNTAAPTVTVSPTQTITCAVPTVTITGSATPSTCTPVWSGGVTSGANSYTATASAANNYTLTATNPANGCTNSAVVQVVPDLGFPNLSSPAISNSITCTLNTSSVVVTTTSTPVSYAWTGTGITSSTTSNSIAVNTGGTYTLVVTNTLSGCTSTVTAFVPTNTTAPVPSASNATTLTCATTTAALTGGPASGVTYQWSGPGFSGGTTSQNATASAPGNYTLLVTSSVNSCTAAATTSVSQNITPPSPTATNTTTLTCTTGTAALTGGPASGVTYQWNGAGFSGGTTSQNAVATAPGIYTLVVTSTVNSCAASATTAVTQNTTAPIPTANNSATLTCTTSTVGLTGGPAAGVTYQWSGPGFSGGTTSQNAIATSAGTYTLVVTSTVNSCSSSATTSVNQNTTAPIPTASNNTTLTCTTGTAALTGGPVSGVTYQWTGPGFSGGTTSQNAIATSAGTYTLVVTSTVNSCSASATVAVTQNTTAPSPIANNGNILTCSTLTTALTGAPASGVTYQWSGPGISGGTTSQNAVANAPGTYTLKVTDAVNSCTAIATTVVSQDIVAPVPYALNSTTLTCSISSATLTGGPLTGGYTYQWSGPGFGGPTNIDEVIATAPGTFTLLVTNSANACFATATVAVTQNTAAPIVAAANSGSLNCSVLSVNASATTTTTPVSYSWSGTGITSATNISTVTVNQGGTFNYTVTNTTNNCITSGTVSITQNTTSPTVAGANTGSLNCTVLNVNASATTTTTPVSYNWSGTGITSAANISTITVNQGGTFTYTVTNTANNCTTINTVTVVQNTTSPSVIGANSGSLNCTVLSVNVSATTTTTPVSYNWSGAGITSATNISMISVNQGGTFTYSVTNTANNCTTTSTVAVVQNTTSPTVTGANTGSLNCTMLSVNASATTSTTPVSYNWSGTGITSATNISTITVNQPGTFNYTVTNTSNGCVATGSETITQNIVTPSVTMPGTQTITCASPTVSLIGSANPSTCTPVWAGGVSSGANSYTATASSATIYTLTVTNPFNNCTNSGTVQVSPSAGFPSVNSSMTNSITCTLTTAQVIASTTTTPVSYSWSGPGSITNPTSSTATVDAGGTYTCVVINTLSACSSTTTIFVPTNTTAVTASIAPTSSINCLATTQVLNANPTGSYSYSWTPDPGLTGTAIATPTVSTGGTYSVVITNTINGCVGSASIAVVSNTVIPTVTISPSTFTTTCTTPTVQLTANTSTNSVSYSWNTPASGTLTSSSISNPIANGAGVFTVVVTNTVNGCVSAPSTSSISIDVVAPTATLSTNSLSITCTNPTPGTSATSSTSSVSYSWTPGSGIASGAASANPTFTAAGTYSVIVTNTVNGCASNVSVNTVTVTLDNTIPTITISPSQTLTCTTPSIVISTTVSPGTGVTYDWNGNGVTGATTNTVDVNQPGVYSTTVTNPVNGCSVTANVSISSNTISPAATIAVNSITTTCSAPTATLNATSSPSTGVSYNWTAPASGSLNTFTVSNPVAGGSGIFTVTVTDNTNGCSTASSQATVEIIPDAATPAVNVSANSLTITCTNTTVTTALTSTTNISSYTWNPSPVTGGANPVFDTPGVYTATIIASNGCPTNVSVNVDIDTTVPSVTLTSATNDGTLTCLTTSITITPTISPNSNLTYTWSPSTGLSSSANQASATFTAAGIYTLAVTNTVTGCVTSLTNTANTFSVTEDNLAPTFTLGTAPSVTTTCSSPNATLSGTSNADPNSVYTWTTPTSTTLTGNPIVNSTPGTYSVTVTNTVNGCSTSASAQPTVEVVADAGIPNVTLSSNSVSITCSNPTPSVSITTTAIPVSYSWSPSTGIAPGTETTANPSFTAAGSYSVVVTNTTSGCATSISNNVVDVILDNAIPSITLSATSNSGTITCTNTFVPISPIVTPTANLTYTWSPGGVVSSSINDATFTTAGIYTLVVTNSLTGCVSSSTNTANTYTVTADNAAISATIIPTSTNTIISCAIGNSSVTLQGNSSATAPSYTWMPGSITTQTFVASASGDYTLTVVDVNSGCSTSTIITVNGGTTTPQGVDAGASANIACGSSSLALNGVSNSTTGVTYSWNGPSATSIVSGTETTLNPIVTEAGDYTLTVTDNLTGCFSSDIVSVSQAIATASIIANPTSGTSPLDVAFTGTGTGSPLYSWSFGDGNTSNSQNPNNTFTTGTYTVFLTTTSGSCTATASVVIVVEDGLTMEIPNVFTPNADGANDVFSIKSTGVKEISLQIFNRWGEKLYEFSGPKASWDGLAPNGLVVPAGTYFYFVKATGFDDTEIEKHGSLNLFR